MFKNYVKYLWANLLVFMVSLPALAGDIVITEIMQNPSAVSDADGEWLEIYNKGAQTINLNGWTLRDNGSDSHVIAQDVFIAPGAYAVLGRNATSSSSNGDITVAYQYSSFTLGNGADEAILEDNGGTIIDEVAYDGGGSWPDPTGASMELSSAAVDNNVGGNWAIATDVLASGDKATPGTGPDAGSGGVIPPELVFNDSVIRIYHVSYLFQF